MKPLVIFGPSGVGKGTIINCLLQKYPNIFQLSTSFTTRSPRPGETHGKEYFFVSKDEFQDQIAKGQMLEFKTVFQNTYGTSKQHVEKIALEKKIAILDVDIEGMSEIKDTLEAEGFSRYLGAPLCLCILPASYTLLKQRLTDRKTQSEDVIVMRMKENTKQINKMLQLGNKNWRNLYFVTNYQYQLTVYGVERWLQAEHPQFSAEMSTKYQDEQLKPSQS